MTGPVHFMEFKTPGGVLLQRLGAIDSIIENRSAKGVTFFIVVGNNAKIEVLGETRESLKERLSGAGTNIVIVPLPEDVPLAMPAPPEPVGNAVLPPSEVALPEPEPVE